MYFFAGSEVCLNVIPVVAVMSSSCGTARPAHLADLAPGGGGGGVGCPPCAVARSAVANNIRIAFASRLHRIIFKFSPSTKDFMGFGRPEWLPDRAHAASLSIPC